MTDDLAIPAFLRRTKENDMKNAEPETVEEILETQDTAPNDEGESLETILSRIKTMTAQRDKLTEAISAHKKFAQKLIGKL